MSEAKCIECGGDGAACKCPRYAAEETRAQAHARGVAEERARWEAACDAERFAGFAKGIPDAIEGIRKRARL